MERETLYFVTVWSTDLWCCWLSFASLQGLLRQWKTKFLRGSDNFRNYDFIFINFLNDAFKITNILGFFPVLSVAVVWEESVAHQSHGQPGLTEEPLWGKVASFFLFVLCLLLPVPFSERDFAILCSRLKQITKNEMENSTWTLCDPVNSAVLCLFMWNWNILILQNFCL